MKYAVTEVYATIQGEGLNTGVPAVFVRLHGCGVGCPFCDTKYTWQQDRAHLRPSLAEAMLTPEGWTWLECNELVQAVLARAGRIRLVVLTGGEPLEQDCDELMELLWRHLRIVQVETSGTAPLHRHRPDILTVSPKVNMPGGKTVLPAVLAKAHEIKYVIGKPGDLDTLDGLLASIEPGARAKIQVALQPMSGSQKATDLCVKACLDRGFRLSLQTHKLIGLA